MQTSQRGGRANRFFSIGVPHGLDLVIPVGGKFSPRVTPAWGIAHENIANPFGHSFLEHLRIVLLSGI